MTDHNITAPPVAEASQTPSVESYKLCGVEGIAYQAHGTELEVSSCVNIVNHDHPERQDAKAPPPPDTQLAYRLAGIPNVYHESSFSAYRERISRMKLTELCNHAGEVEVATSWDISALRDRLERHFLIYHPEHRDEAATLTREARERNASMTPEERAVLIADSDKRIEEERRCRETL